MWRNIQMSRYLLGHSKALKWSVKSSNCNHLPELFSPLHKNALKRQESRLLNITAGTLQEALVFSCSFKCLWTCETRQRKCLTLCLTRGGAEWRHFHVYQRWKADVHLFSYKTDTLLFLLYLFFQESAVIKSPLIHRTSMLTYTVKL